MSTQKIGHFNVEQPLGAGAMGEVFLGYDPKLARRVALKVLPERLCHDVSLKQRFLFEARAASAVNHPNICTIHEVGETATGQPYICMEYIDGKTLETTIENEPCIPLDQSIQLITEVLGAVSVAHRHGIVHRDLKPGNIATNSQGLLKILDFGLAKRAISDKDTTTVDDTANLTLTGGIHGTPNYMSPEQASGRDVNHLSDLFSIGIMLYQFLTGELPFAGRSIPETLSKILHDEPVKPRELNSGITNELEQVVLKSLGKKKGERFQSAEEFREALIRVVQPAGETTSLVSSGSPADSDVFISYSSIDEQSFAGESEGWISRFHRNLQVKLQQLAGRPVSIYQPIRHSDDQPPPDHVLRDLPRAKSFLTVVSPPFTNSNPCEQELNSFLTQAVVPDSKIIKVVKSPVEESKLDAMGQGILRQVGNHDFFAEDATGRVLEFESSFGEELKRRYYEKIYDVAHELNSTLSENLDDTLLSVSPAPIAYVARSTSDVQEEYEIICRELRERGYRIVPERPLPLERDALVDAVRDALQSASLVVQTIGRHYGIVPENSDRSIQALQAEQIREWIVNADAQQFIWLEDKAYEDPRHADFVTELQKIDASRYKCELIEGNLSLLKEAIAQFLASLENQEASGEGAARPNDVNMIYLICDSVDEAATEPLEDLLFKHGFEVTLPEFDCDQDQVNEFHVASLVECDAAIIFYGGTQKGWVDIKLRDTLKAAGYGRKTSLENVAVYIAPPNDRRKDRFKSHHADVISQGESGELNVDALVEFIQRIKKPVT